MNEREDYESEIKFMKKVVHDHAAVDEVISKGKISELIKLMNQHLILRDVMWKSIRNPVVYGGLRKRDQIEIQEAIVKGMNWWLEDQVWNLNDDSEDSESSQ